MCEMRGEKVEGLGTENLWSPVSSLKRTTHLPLDKNDLFGYTFILSIQHVRPRQSFNISVHYLRRVVWVGEWNLDGRDIEKRIRLFRGFLFLFYFCAHARAFSLSQSLFSLWGVYSGRSKAKGGGSLVERVPWCF